MAAKRRSQPARAAAVDLPRRRVPAVARLAPSGRSLLVAFLLLAAGVGAYVGARETSVFAVRSIEIRGAPAPLARDVRRALVPLERTSLVELDAAAVHDRVAELPWVAEIRYDRAFPNTLRVWVEPERPAAVLRRGADSWLVSTRGRVLERTKPRARLALPRVWLAAGAAPRVGAPAPRAATPAIAALATAADLPLFSRVKTARLDGDAVTLVLRSGAEVRLGEAHEVALKLEIARRLLPAVAVPGYVDLSVPDRPVVGGNPQVEG